MKWKFLKYLWTNRKSLFEDFSAEERVKQSIEKTVFALEKTVKNKPIFGYKPLIDALVHIEPKKSKWVPAPASKEDHAIWVSQIKDDKENTKRAMESGFDTIFEKEDVRV